MREWAIMLGGLTVWALHFLAVYALASLADLSHPAQAPAWRAAGLVATGLSVAALGLILLAARSSRNASGLARTLGPAGCGLSLIAVIWQSLPLMVSH